MRLGITDARLQTLSNFFASDGDQGGSVHKEGGIVSELSKSLSENVGIGARTPPGLMILFALLAF